MNDGVDEANSCILTIVWDIPESESAGRLRTDGPTSSSTLEKSHIFNQDNVSEQNIYMSGDFENKIVVHNC